MSSVFEQSLQCSHSLTHSTLSPLFRALLNPVFAAAAASLLRRPVIADAHGLQPGHTSRPNSAGDRAGEVLGLFLIPSRSFPLVPFDPKFSPSEHPDTGAVGLRCTRTTIKHPIVVVTSLVTRTINWRVQGRRPRPCPPPKSRGGNKRV